MKVQPLPGEVARHVRAVLQNMAAYHHAVELHHCFRNAQLFVVCDVTGRSRYCEGLVQNPHGEGQPWQQHAWPIVDGFIVDITRELLATMHPALPALVRDDVYRCDAVYTRAQLLGMEWAVFGGPLSYKLEEVKQNG